MLLMFMALYRKVNINDESLNTCNDNREIDCVIICELCIDIQQGCKMSSSRGLSPATTVYYILYIKRQINQAIKYLLQLMV